MTDEQRKEICKSFSYGYTVKEIAEIEKIPTEEAENAIAWGEQTQYMDELKNRGE